MVTLSSIISFLIITGITAFAVSIIYVTISREKYLKLQIEFEEAQTLKFKAQTEYQEMLNKRTILDGLKNSQDLDIETSDETDLID